MMPCVYCIGCKHYRPKSQDYCAHPEKENCSNRTFWEPPVKTNADRIRSMTDEELAILLGNTEADFPPNFPGGVSVKQCETAWLDWLRQEVSDDKR